jgi:uncharacterized protein YqeY
MELTDRLNEDLREAIRSRDEPRRTTIRLLLSALHNAEIAARHPLDDRLAQDVLNTQAKQRREAAEQFRAGKREDLATREDQELAILEQYMPRQLDRDEVVDEARRVIEEVGATGPADLRKVMPPLMERLRNRADGRLVSQVVRDLLAASGGQSAGA